MTGGLPPAEQSGASACDVAHRTIKGVETAALRKRAGLVANGGKCRAGVTNTPITATVRDLYMSSERTLEATRGPRGSVF